MSSERDGGGAAEEQWSDPIPDAPVVGLYFSGELRIAAAPEAFLLLMFQSNLLLHLPFLQGMRDVRASPPPIPEDAEQ